MALHYEVNVLLYSESLGCLFWIAMNEKEGKRKYDYFEKSNFIILHFSTLTALKAMVYHSITIF